MANNLTDAAENEILDHLCLTGAAFTPGSPLRVALYTVAPTEAGGGTEVSASGTAYARTATGAFTAATGGSTSNSADITFPTATASWGTVAALAIFENGGVMLWYGPLTASKTVDSGDTFKIPAGSLTLSLN